MNALVWLKGALKRDLFADESGDPGLAPSRSSGGSRAANPDGAPRKHGAFHSSRPPDRKALLHMGYLSGDDEPITPSFGNAAGDAANAPRARALWSSI